MEESAVYRDENTLAVLARIRIKSLSPAEQPSSQKILKKADTYQQRFLKYPHRGAFHSYAEFIHALLLESRAAISTFVPQPFRLLVGNKPYIPDCYVCENNRQIVIEMKPKGQMVDPSPLLIEQFFNWHRMEFQVVSNESVMEHEQEALNWLPLVQVMVVAERYGLDTSAKEQELLQYCITHSGLTVGDLLSPRRREDQSDEEVALYRLLHLHRLETDLDRRPLNYDSELRVCF